MTDSLESSVPPDTAPTRVSGGFVVAIGMILLLWAGIGGVTVLDGKLAGDEGWYTLAASQVREGRAPYRDFLFTQMPLLPYVYGAWSAVAGPGLMAARGLSLLLGTLALILTMAAAYRKGGRTAAVLAGFLIATNLSIYKDVCQVKTQALTFFMTALTLWASTFGGRAPFLGLLIPAAAGMSLTRLSMLPATLATWILALLRWRRGPALTGLVATVALASLALGHLWSGGNLPFGVLEFHALYFGNPAWQWNVTWDLFLKGFLADQLPLLVAGASATILFLVSPRAGEDRTWLRMVLFAYVSTSAIHMSRPIAFPAYQTSNVAFLAAFTAVVWGRLVTEITSTKLAGMSVLLPLVLLGAPFQEWDVRPSGEGGPFRLTEVTQFVRSLGTSPDPVFTLSPEIAHSAGLPVVPGWEMAEFCWFPELEEARARELHVTNRAMLARDLAEGRARLVILTEHHVKQLGGEEVLRQLQARYVLLRTIEGYGQFVEPLHLWARVEAGPRR